MTNFCSSSANSVESAGMTTHSIVVQSRLFQFDITESQIVNKSYTSTKKNPIFYYKHRRGSKFDSHNNWQKPAEPADYSRADIARSYRLGKWF